MRMRAIATFVLLAACADDPTEMPLEACWNGSALSCRSDLTLTGDYVLTAPIQLGDGQTLDCKGRKLLPTSVGSGASTTDYVPSVPEVAIAILGKSRATVKNCVIGSLDQRFDFGIVVADTPDGAAGGNKVQKNEIHALSTAVLVVRSDDNAIVNNDITWTVGGGVNLMQDVDRTQVSANDLAQDGTDPHVFARQLPGINRGFAGAKNGGVVSWNPGIEDMLALGVIDMIIGGRLLQYENYGVSSDQCPDAGCPGYGRQDDNVVEGNKVAIPPDPVRANASASNDGGGVYGALLTRRLIVRNNVVNGAGHGVRLAGQITTQKVTRAGHCMAIGGSATNRWCATDFDCAIPGFDAQPIGTCPTDRPVDTVDASSRNTLVQGNLLRGPFDSPGLVRTAIGPGQGTMDGVIMGNTIECAGQESGITLGAYMLMTGTVTGNRISGCVRGLTLLVGNGGTTFGAKISGNDIIGSTMYGVDVNGAYTFPSELSQGTVGNYWGHAAPPCFLPGDSSLPDLIHDSHPACTPFVPK
jgi:hypothetical protein